ncbi:TIGR02221 family CRISPR-associated protein [Nitratiruptor sp. YY09-18]|uniref:TIGR02221 family CRISPR-associated protein n=1 Tax=Nitratiruptor sp. YY09-18 TaxID=2724901 RepID=UPI001915BBA9|nr:TIGR02221 family CRISPR-associated protein [Nitratiruptor sp. YY09-18]BCD68474.1 CRISPR-associated protein Csx1 [Nitratiruptor sp. YY09-18]
MKDKILISLLGKGLYQKENKKYDYSLTSYKIEDKIIQSKLVGDALRRLYNPDKIFIVGTVESLWNLADEYIRDYEKVIIPFGKNSEEFWKVFEVLISLDVDNSEIYFDITHGFRSLPLFISTILQFFKNFKNTEIKGVYYGIFEAKEGDITPIVNMLPFIELNQWIESANIFKKYGDGREIAQLISKKVREHKGDEEYHPISTLANKFDIYTKSVGFAAADIYLETIKEIEEKLEKIGNVPNDIKSFSFIIDELKKETKNFDFNLPKWQLYLTISNVLFHKNRYAQALTILRETLHYYIIEELNLLAQGYKIRDIDASIGYILKYQQHFFKKEFIKLVEQIKDLRNLANHAFIGEKGGKKSLKKSIEHLQNYINQANKVLQEAPIRDKSNLKLFLLNELEKKRKYHK